MSGGQITFFTKVGYFFAGMGAVNIIAYKPFQTYYERNNLYKVAQGGRPAK